jgi:hypothetical protein
MLSLVTTRKRKGIDDPKSSSTERSKIRLIEPTRDGLLDGIGDGLSKPQRGVQTLRDIRRKGVQMLSKFRLNANATASAVKTSSNTVADTQPLGAPQSEDLNTVSNPSEPIVDSTPRLTTPRLDSLLEQLTNPAGYDGESEPTADSPSDELAVLHISRSTPSLSRQLTTKLSNVLMQDATIIHRPKLTFRPTVLTKHLLDNEPTDRAGEVLSLPSQVSSGPESSNGPMSQSTAPTSFVSSRGTLSGETTHRTRNKSAETTHLESQTEPSNAEKCRVHWLHFPRQDVPLLNKPSIATVEKAAAAKIFFESHYNQLLGTTASPRSLRRRQLERKIFAMALPNEQRQHKRQRWYAAESQHLRQTRVMKSKTIVRQDVTGVHVSSYDIVRVLGKGSFGVVRLVREKNDSSSHSNGSGSELGRCTNIGPSHLGLTASSKKRKARQVYAMKVIRKSDMLRNSQEGHLRAERDFLVASENSRWAVPLVASFQDNNNLYLVMEYMVGGDFLGLLLREDILNENVAK